MPPSDFANANIDEIVDKLTTEEAVKIIAGVGFWYTAAIERLGIPAIKVRHFVNLAHTSHIIRYRSVMVRMVRRDTSISQVSQLTCIYLRYSGGPFLHEHARKVPSRELQYSFLVLNFT
jgi:hypothetical protein